MEACPRVEIAFASVNQTGHVAPLIPFMQELHRRGHQITVFMSDQPNYVKLLESSGLSSVKIVGVPLPTLEDMKKAGPWKIVSGGGPVAFESGPLFGAIVEHYQNAPLPAVMFADFFATAACDAADKLGFPAVVCFPNPAGVGFGLPSPRQRSFGDNVKASIACVLEGAAARLFLAGRNRQRALNGLQPLDEQDIWPSTCMKRPVICTWGLGYEYAFVQSPLLTYVGPTMPDNFAPLTGELKQWVDDQSQPILYVAFGTNVKFKERECRKLFEALEGITEAAVIWSLPAVQQRMLPSGGASARIRLETFTPQMALLTHSKVVAFVTHCGANSISESILAETPMICCPQMADQPANAARVASAGVGVVSQGGVGIGVHTALHQILADLNGYQKRVKRLKRILMSNGGAKRGADLVEHIATVGYDHMIPVGRRLSWSRCVLCIAALLVGGRSLKLM